MHDSKHFRLGRVILSFRVVEFSRLETYRLAFLHKNGTEPNTRRVSDYFIGKFLVRNPEDLIREALVRQYFSARKDC
jgi:hypothetical protein